MLDPDYAVAVCGFGRCGSTMAMQMLAAGGLRPGNADEPPYEGDRVAMAGEDFTGTCVKLLDKPITAAVLAGPTRAWRFIWLDRNRYEQALSYLKFLKHLAPLTGITGDNFTPEQVANTFRRDRPGHIAQLHAAGRVLVLNYDSVLADPAAAADRVRQKILPGLDVTAAAAQVHQRDGLCRPDLAVELAFNHHPLGACPPATTRSAT